MLTTVALPLALAIIMFGLGLSLRIDDFRRIAAHPRPVAVALVAQLLLLPAVCFGLVVVFDLDPVLAVGMMVLAASPGGTTANLFSHLFRGDVALNISLTAVNSVLAVVTLPIVVNFSLNYFDPDIGDGDVGLQFTKMIQVFAIVLIPVVIGMIVRAKAIAFAKAADRPVRIASALVLGMVIAGALLSERGNVGGYVADVGLLTTVFCACSLAIGYVLPKLARVREKQAIASAFEVGVHNSALAIAVAVSVLDSEKMAVPAAVYGVVMLPMAAIAGLLITWTRQRSRAAASARDSSADG